MVMVINNESSYDSSSGKIIGGNITDRAIMEYVGVVNYRYEMIKQEVFDSKKKYMYTKIRKGGHTYNLVKGAYEVVGKCVIVIMTIRVLNI